VLKCLFTRHDYGKATLWDQGFGHVTENDKKAGGLTRFFADLRALWSQDVPASVSDALAVKQYEQLRELVPVLYLTIAVVSIAAGLAARQNLSWLYQIALPGILTIVSIHRYFAWRKRGLGDITPSIARTHLQSILFAAVPMAILGGMAGMGGFLQASEQTKALPPMFLVLAALACANCLSSYPRAAIYALILGLLPVCTAMLLLGDTAIKAIAITIVVVSILQTRFIQLRHLEMLQNLILHEEMRQLADTDPLTGLANRRAFSARLVKRFAQDNDHIFAVAMIDLDGFKPANDRFGHAAGDAILVEVAQRLQTLCATASCVARIGGDEFAILFEDSSDKAIFHERAAAIRKVLALPYAVENELASLSASIGVACYPDNGRSLDALLKSADRALYAEKAGQVVAEADAPASVDQLKLFG
jgi:diguanylate cyclase (GGDEF)-like protein